MKTSGTDIRPTTAPAIVVRSSLCGIALPCLTLPQRTTRFFFPDATLLLITSGCLGVEFDTQKVAAEAGGAPIAVDSNTYANLTKTPGGNERQFRSIFLTIDASLLSEFERRHPASSAASKKVPVLELGTGIESEFLKLVESVQASTISDDRVRYKLLEFLLMLAERGFRFAPANSDSVSRRLRTMISEAPAAAWTADSAARVLAMSAATLRRRLTNENTQFEELLIDTRMHHALMLFQTTNWKISYVAEVSGYKSRGRFSERFQQRFGYSPSSIR